MIEIRSYHKFNFFGQVAAIDPSPENMAKYLSSFSFLGLIPTIVQQVELQGNTHNGLLDGTAVKMRLQFISQPSKQWVVDVNNGSMAITKLRDEEGTLGSRKEFFDIVLKIIDILTDSYAIKASRVSYLTKNLDSETDESKLIEANAKIFHLPPFYQENPPFEWDTRNVSEVSESLGGDEEKINVITKVSRKSGVLMYTNEPYDQMEIEFDINTTHLSKKPRLGESHIKDFTVFLDKILPRLEEEVLGVISK